MNATNIISFSCSQILKMERVTEELKKIGLEKYSALLEGILSLIKYIKSYFIKYCCYSLLFYGFNYKNFTAKQMY